MECNEYYKENAPLEEVKAMPPLSDEEKKITNEAKPIESDDCPFMAKKKLEEFKHRSKVYKPTKSKIPIMIDNDVLAALKAEGKGYQTRINAILRKEVMGA